MTPPMWSRERKPAADHPSEATLSRRKAERDLAATRAETPKYEEFGARLRELRERNNFAAAFRHSIQGGRW